MTPGTELKRSEFAITIFRFYINIRTLLSDMNMTGLRGSLGDHLKVNVMCFDIFSSFMNKIKYCDVRKSSKHATIVSVKDCGFKKT